MTVAAGTPDDYADPVLAEVGLAVPGPADAALAKKLEAWFVASAPGPLPALPESVRTFVAKGEATPPLHRWSLLDGGIVERWEPVEQRFASIDVNTIALLANQDRVIGWNVVRLPLNVTGKTARIVIVDGKPQNLDAFGRPVEPIVLTGQALREHVMSLQQTPEDDATYNGFYPTLLGNDIAHYQEGLEGFGEGFRHDMTAHQNGEKMRKVNPDWDDPTEDGYLHGGREIRGGRAEHREATKHMIHMDAGYQRDVDRIAAEKKADRTAEGRLKIEMTLRAGPEKDDV